MTSHGPTYLNALKTEIETSDPLKVFCAREVIQLRDNVHPYAFAFCRFSLPRNTVKTATKCNPKHEKIHHGTEKFQAVNENYNKYFETTIHSQSIQTTRKKYFIFKSHPRTKKMQLSAFYALLHNLVGRRFDNSNSDKRATPIKQLRTAMSSQILSSLLYLLSILFCCFLHDYCFSYLSTTQKTKALDMNIPCK